MKVESKLHPRSKHKGKYDFEKLISVVPALKSHVVLNPAGEKTIPFSDPEAVKMLNKAILFSDYNIEYWDIPKGQLCPPIPGRADYIHYLADLISETSSSKSNIKILDIGVGANLIYPIVGTSIYNWNFVGSDISEESLKNAHLIIKENSILKDKIELRFQSDELSVFKNIIKENEYFDAVLCNPPFYKSEEDAAFQNKKKNLNLGRIKSEETHNFGGKNNELWCKGGELEFVSRLIIESVFYKKQVGYFTSLVSNKDNLKILERVARKNGIDNLEIIKMSQGNKQSRFIAWRFS